MNKILAILFCLISFTAGAQQFRYGFHVSPVVNLWKLEPDLYERYGPNTGIQYGLLLDQTFGAQERIALSAGITLDYTQGGMASVESTKNWMVRAEYVELPVSLKLRTNQLGIFTPYLEAGATFAKCTSALGDYTENGVRHDSDIDYLQNDNPNGLSYLPNNFSVDAGLGTEIAITETASILVGFYFKNGFSDIFQDNNEKSDILLQQAVIHIGGLF